MRLFLFLSTIAVFALPVAAKEPRDPGHEGGGMSLTEAGQYFRALPDGHPEKRCTVRQSCDTVSNGRPARWNVSDLSVLCGYINGMTLNRQNSFGQNTKYIYQAIIRAFSGVRETDGAELIAKKTRVMAPAIMTVKCNNPNFNQPEGNLLKFVIAKQFDNFVIDVTHTWKWDSALNVVDAVDGRTALDYAYDEYAAETARRSSIADKVKTYITIMELNGAKRARELKR